MSSDERHHMPEDTLTSKLQPLDDAAFADDDREIMIKVDHVTMEFNMASEQLNSLKEYAIALAKHKLYFEKFTALNDISFEVKKGDVFGILGTNGSGKSTLLKIIAGVLEPTKGSCEINGNIAPLIELGAGFDMELSARENIYLNGSLLGYSKQFIEEHFDDIVSFAEIEKFLDMPMKNYSSGMIARIAFAIATVIVPEILIVDEVLSVGDFMFQQKCENRINDLIEKHGVTVLIVSHSNDQIERLCNKAIWIEKGHERIIGDATRVCNAYRILGGRVGTPESETVVYNALVRSENEVHANHPKIFTGKDHFEIASSATLANWNSENCEHLFLIPDHTHVFDLAIAGLAGALNAPILPVSNSEIPPIIKNAILALNPSFVYIAADNEVACRLSKDTALQNIVNDVVAIPCNAGCRGIRLATLQFGINRGLWGSSGVALLSYHDDLLSSFAISPYAYIAKMPFIITDPKRTVIEDDVLQQLDQIGIKRFITIGTISNSPIVENLLSKQYKITTVTESDDYKALHNIFKWLKDNDISRFNSCLVSSGDKAKMQSILSAPAIAGKTGSGILLEDTTDLDSVADCIRIISKNPEIQKTFLGYKELLGENIKLLSAL